MSEDARRCSLGRGLSALLPTLITLWLLIWVWSFLWENLGRHIISAGKQVVSVVDDPDFDEH